MTHNKKHTQWLPVEIHPAGEDPRPSIPHEDMMAEMEAHQVGGLGHVTGLWGERRAKNSVVHDIECPRV